MKAHLQILIRLANGTRKCVNAAYTANACGVAVREFAYCVKDRTLEGLTRRDLLAFIAAKRDRGISARTTANRLAHLKTFFLNFGIAWPLLKTDKVRRTEKSVGACSAEDLNRLFAVTTQEETELFQFLLCAGVREQEATFAAWRDVDFARTRSKRGRNWNSDSRSRIKRRL